MSILKSLSAQLDSLTAADRQIAQFIIDNPNEMLGMSSAALAEATGRSQSSVVKFSQKLGYKGYPDLKYSIGEAIARADNGEDRTSPDTGESTERPDPAGELWRSKSEAQEETRSINPPDAVEAVADAIADAARRGRAFIIGLGEDDIHARSFALRLSLLGILTVHNFDTAHMTASVSAAAAGDVLLVFSEHGKQPALCQISRLFRQRGGTVVTVTRHTSNPLRAHADLTLLVSAHDDRPHIEPLLYHSALQHLLDRVFVLLCESGRDEQLQANLERIRPMLEG